MRGHMWLNKVASVLGPLLIRQASHTSGCSADCSIIHMFLRAIEITFFFYFIFFKETQPSYIWKKNDEFFVYSGKLISPVQTYSLFQNMLLIHIAPLKQMIVFILYFAGQCSLNAKK